ncbi:hypothetical protein TanjilG_00123 [Lupinus angustifolius]|uniref:Uncharacterized protein n=1 Tax=Lupinus angustifolius TaxID=3871 RepID=A0A1J7GVU6_LUPAN|nr:PREDICTED: uncharacterized protein LOC109356084 [Lupinus angustifolius]OIW04687.1 hypothetical protein TanjilG_00123 [Lupinus angustifolius]
MEPSRDLASAREGDFNGSESGWTSYIGSCIYSEVYIDDEKNVHMEDYNYKNANGKVIVVHDDDKYDERAENNNKGACDEESDDDSMASDASSGPSHFQLVCINNEGRSNGLVYKKQKENDNEKIFSSKRGSKQVRKTKYEYKVEKEEEDSVLLIADSAASHV